MGWKGKAAGAAAAAQVIANVVGGSSDVDQLADHHQRQNEQRMEQVRDGGGASRV
jgi:hypothetical protein